MYPSRNKILALRVCQSAPLLFIIGAFIAMVVFHQSELVCGGVALLCAGVMLYAYLSIEDLLEIPADELRDDQDPFIRELARQLATSKGYRAFIRVPLKRLKGESCFPRDVRVALTTSEMDWEYGCSAAVCRRYRVQETDGAYSLEYCDFDAQFSVPLPLNSKR